MKKANKAPEKIWISDDTEVIWVKNPYSTRFIEYTRTDAFIEKACEWLKEQDEMIGISFTEDFILRFKQRLLL